MNRLIKKHWNLIFKSMTDNKLTASDIGDKWILAPRNYYAFIVPKNECLLNVDKNKKMVEASKDFIADNAKR